MAGTLLPARADTTGSFAGNVAYVNSARIGVKSGQDTRDFIVTGDTTVVKRSNGDKIQYSAIKVGSFVTVKYLQSAAFGSTRATKIIVGSQFNGLKINFTPGPLPTASP